MASLKQKLSHRTWAKDNYLISTDPARISLPDLNSFFASDIMYWASAQPEEVLRETIENSLCFGLYELPTNEDDQSVGKLIGFGRGITDFTTFLYLTDVYVAPQHQGRGLGAWLINCVQEVIEEMPYLRRSLLFTYDWHRSVPFYEKLMKMEVMESARPAEKHEEGKGAAAMQYKGPAFPAHLR